jgi:hypothetical protein
MAKSVQTIYKEALAKIEALKKKVTSEESSKKYAQEERDKYVKN